MNKINILFISSYILINILISICHRTLNWITFKSLYDYLYPARGRRDANTLSNKQTNLLLVVKTNSFDLLDQQRGCYIEPRQCDHT